MQPRTRKTKNSVNSGFLLLIERFWLVIIGLIVAVPFILRYLKDASVKNYTNDQQEQIKLNAVANLSPITQLSGMNKITTNVAYHDWARKLAFDLGTLAQSRWGWLSWLNPSGWTENDKAVYDSLKNVTNTGQKRILNELYFFLVQKNLNEDVIRLLDPELLAKLPMFN